MNISSFSVLGWFAESAGDVAVPRSVRVVWTWLDSGFVAVGPRLSTTFLGRLLMSVHLGAKKRPAAGVSPCLPAAANLSATAPQEKDLPLVDSGPTLGIQAPPVELSGKVGELAAANSEWSRQFVSLLHSKKVSRL